MKSKKPAPAWSPASTYWRAADAQAALVAWSRSGLPLAAFAREHGIPIAKLRRWKGRLGRPAPAVAFHRVKVSGGQGGALAHPSASSVDVVVRGGRSLRVHSGFDAELLRQVVEAMESWPC